MSKISSGPLNWALLLALGLIWGGSFPAVELALAGFAPLTIAGLRITLAAVILVAVALSTGVGLPPLNTQIGRRVWVHCLGMAVFSNALPFTLLSWGQISVTSGFAGISMAVVPLFVLPLAWLLLPDETLTPRKIVGFLIGFAGVAVLIGPQIFQSTGAGLENLARLACIGAALCYAIGGIITRLTPKTPLLSFSAAALLLASLISMPMALMFEGMPSIQPTTATAAILYLGLVPTALATLVLVRIINQMGPGFLSMVNYQVPVWAVLIGALALGEAVPGRFIGALGLILVGMAISQVRIRGIRPI